MRETKLFFVGAPLSQRQTSTTLLGHPVSCHDVCTTSCGFSSAWSSRLCSGGIFNARAISVKSCPRTSRCPCVPCCPCALRCPCDPQPDPFCYFLSNRLIQMRFTHLSSPGLPSCIIFLKVFVGILVKFQIWDISWSVYGSSVSLVSPALIINSHQGAASA